MRTFAIALLMIATGAITRATAGAIVLSGALSASQVVPPGGSASTATGFATVTIDTDLGTLITDFNWNGLTGPADRAHVHDAPEGESLADPPNDRFFHEVINDLDRSIDCAAWGVFDLCVPTSGSSHDEFDLASRVEDYVGCDPLTDVCGMAQFVDMALTNGLYLDIHTQMYTDGELRGQLVVAGVPEPATIWLVALGVSVLWIRRTMPWRGFLRSAFRGTHR